jgi:hypothetical protein
VPFCSVALLGNEFLRLSSWKQPVGVFHAHAEHVGGSVPLETCALVVWRRQSASKLKLLPIVYNPKGVLPSVMEWGGGG